MDHVALDRPRSHDRDLDDEVVETRRLHARQHAHLRAGLDLEGAERVVLLDHRIDVRIVVLQVGHADRHALGFLQQVEGAVHAAEHAQAQHIDFHELQRIDIVLVPFDDLRSTIAAGSMGTRSSSRSWVRTKPPGCCDRWRGTPISWRDSSSARRSRRSSMLRPSWVTCFSRRRPPGSSPR